MYQHIAHGIEVAQEKLTELQTNLKEFDAAHPTSTPTEKATVYFSAVMEKTQTALKDLGTAAQSLKGSASEIPIKALSTTFAKVNAAFAELRETAKSYDDKYGLSSTVTAAITAPREQAGVAIATASSYAAQAANTATAQLQGVSDGIRLRLVSHAECGLQKALPVAVSLDEKHHLKERAADAATVMTQKAKELDEKYAVLETLKGLDARYSLSGYLTAALGGAKGLDQKVTGGRVEPAVLSAYDLGLKMAGYMQDKYEAAKKEMHEEGAKAEPEPVPEPAEPAPAPAVEAH